MGPEDTITTKRGWEEGELQENAASRRLQCISRGFLVAEGVWVSSQALLRASSALLGPIPMVGFWATQQRKLTFVQLQRPLLGCFPHGEVQFAYKKSLPEERQAVCLTI